MNKLLVTIFLIVIYWSFFLTGPRVASDFHYSYPEHLKSLFDFPYLWSNRWGGGLGHYVSSLWAWPIELLYGLSGFLNLNFSITERLLGPLLVVAIGFFSIRKLLNFYKVTSIGNLAGTSFFLSNSYLILLIDGGQLNLAIAYSILPLSFYLYQRFIKSYRYKDLILFTFSIFGISIVDLRIAVLLFLLIVINLIFTLIYPEKLVRPEIIKRNLLLGTFSFNLLILFNSYWILPIIFTKTTEFIPQNYLNFAQVDFFSFSKIENGIFLQQPHWFENDFGKISPINSDFILIPLLIFIIPILLKRDRRVGFWLIISVTFIFLSKGTNPPLPQVNSWLLNNIPVFILFRDPTKFYFLIALSYSILIGISSDELIRRFTRVKYGKVLFPILILGYFLYLNLPVITLKMNGMFSPPIFEDEFQVLNKEIKNDKDFGRVLWIPVKFPLGYESPNSPAVDAFALMERRPFAIGNKGTYERLNFLRESSHSGQLLEVLGVKSIIYPPLDYRKDISEDEKEYYFTFLNQLKNSLYINGADPDSNIPKLDLINHQERFFIPENFWWVVGSDKVYKESTKSANLNLSNNVLFFAEEAVDSGKKITEYPFAKILLNTKKELDFSASLLSKEEMIFPAKDLEKDPDASGWWKRDKSDFLFWKDFLKTKYGILNQDFDFGGGWSVAEEALKLEVADEKIKKDKLLFARVLESTRSGHLNFYQSGELIGSINTNKPGDNIRWFEIGKLKNNNPLNIQSKGEINVINALAVVDETKWNELNSLAETILDKQLVDSYNQAEEKNQNLKLNYTKLNPTKFVINISGLESPKMLIFSDSFNNLWQLNGQKSLPVYSMINGFLIEKDGEYIVEFYPQKYVYPGLAISAITFIILLVLLLKRKDG